MQTVTKSIILQSLLENTTVKKHAALLLGLNNLACDLESYCQHLESIINHPDAEPVNHLASYFTPFELN
ncbi:MAG TPA: hypothetical protein VJZ26_05905 [Blastocatellia bacterium]|nr:hypothetical protein [Blastocatellia bacterium]